MSITRRFYEVLVSDLRALKFSQGTVSILLAFGFWLSNVDTENYDYLNGIFSKAIWGDIFLGYGIFRICSTLYDIWDSVKFIGGFIGIWLWTYILLSFTVYDPTTIKSTEWMLIIPLMAETWMFAECLFKRKNKCIGCSARG